MSKTLVALLALSVAWARAGAAAPLPPVLDKLLDEHAVSAEHVGLYLAPLDAEGRSVTLNAERAFNPASVIKLLPSLAALERFTPAYRWFTDIYRDGRLDGGVLHGDLYVRGGGDPYLTVESIWAMFKAIRARGIDRINGDIVVDEGIFRLPPFDRAAFDDQPYRVYNGPPGALMVNFWGVSFTVTARPDGVHIDAFPGSPRLKIVNRVEHSTSPCGRSNRGVNLSFRETADSTVAVFDGVLSSRCPAVVMTRAAIPVERYLAYVLPGLWRDAGGALDGGVRHGIVPEGAARMYRHPSRSLASVVRATNKFSNNMMARHLLLTLGSRYRDRGIDVSDGIKALHDWLAARGLELPGLRVVNGSGLSRDVRVSALGMARLLRAGYHSPYAPEFLASLPVAGEDRALASRAFARAAGRPVRMKTGLLDHVRAMAGYVPSRSGETYIVVLLINQPGIHRGGGTRLQNAVVRYVMGL